MSSRQRGHVIEAPPLEKMFDKEPPRALEAEMSVLGSMILDSRLCDEVGLIIPGPEAFYDPRHGVIYTALQKVFEKTGSGDLVQVSQALKDADTLAEVGGIDYLETLASAVPFTSNAPHFARLVADKYRLRRLIEAAGKIIFDCYHVSVSGRSVQETVDEAETLMFAVADEEQAGESSDLGSLIAKQHERLKAIADGRARATGIETGFYDLDEMLGGMGAGELILIAARPSMGKSALAINIAEQLATGRDGSGVKSSQEPVPVGVFSLEMSKDTLSQRMLAASAGIDGTKVRRGLVSAEELERTAAVADELARCPFHIDDTPGLSVSQLRARARRMVQRHKVGALIIDYLQLISAPQRSGDNRQVEVAAISRGVKALARELKIPVICLSQLNRGAENREGNRPRLSDLRESGSLEQDADVVLLLHREEYYHIGDTEWFEKNPDKRGVAEIIIAKQRNGPTGSVPLTWEPAATRFRNATGNVKTAIAAAVRGVQAREPDDDDTPAWAKPSEEEA